jgi:hypothetical protein
MQFQFGTGTEVRIEEPVKDGCVRGAVLPFKLYRGITGPLVDPQVESVRAGQPAQAGEAPQDARLESAAGVAAALRGEDTGPRLSEADLAGVPVVRGHLPWDADLVIGAVQVTSDEDGFAPQAWRGGNGDGCGSFRVRVRR